MNIDDMTGLAKGLNQSLFGLAFVCASPNAMMPLSEEAMRRALGGHATGTGKTSTRRIGRATRRLFSWG